MTALITTPTTTASTAARRSQAAPAEVGEALPNVAPDRRTGRVTPWGACRTS
jgi:hypothetical protein